MNARIYFLVGIVLAAVQCLAQAALSQVTITEVNRSTFVRGVSSVPEDPNNGGQTADENHAVGPWQGGGSWGPGIAGAGGFANAAAVLSQQTDISSIRFQGSASASIDLSTGGNGSCDGSAISNFAVTFSVPLRTVASISVDFLGSTGSRSSTLVRVGGDGATLMSTSGSFDGPVTLLPGTYRFTFDLLASGACSGACAQSAARQGSFDVTFAPLCPDAFHDDFNPPSPYWNNALGNWTAVNGEYFAQNAGNLPPTYSGLPFDVQDFELTVRVNGLADGGIWLRSDGNNTNGILLVTGGNGYGQGVRGGSAGRQLYFHRVVNGGYGGALAATGDIFVPGSTHTLRVLVSGNTYSVFVDGSPTPATVLTDSTFTIGRIGLYCDQPNIPAGGFGPPQTFSDFTLLGNGPLVTQQPVSASVCPQGSASFEVRATAAGISGTLAYQWQWQPSEGAAWLELLNGANSDPLGGDVLFTAIGAKTAMMSVTATPGGSTALPRRVRCVVSNACGNATSNEATFSVVGTKCQPADIAWDTGDPLPPAGPCNLSLINTGVNEGDYNAFFQGFFDAAAQCDIADDQGTALPPFGNGGSGGAENTGVNEGDYNCFFQFFFNGCP